MTLQLIVQHWFPVALWVFNACLWLVSARLLRSIRCTASVCFTMTKRDWSWRCVSVSVAVGLSCWLDIVCIRSHFVRLFRSTIIRRTDETRQSWSSSTWTSVSDCSGRNHTWRNIRQHWQVPHAIRKLFIMWLPFKSLGSVRFIFSRGALNSSKVTVKTFIM